jgi:hypothetical protein
MEIWVGSIMTGSPGGSETTETTLKRFLVTFAASERHKIDSAPTVPLLPPPPIAAARNATSHPFHRPLVA